jgi:hypothetical protein
MPARLRDILTLQSDPLSVSLLPIIQKLDELHSVPHIPPIPLKINRSRSQEGAYVYSGAQSLRIEISKWAQCPEWTFIHEVGHLLDHQGLNPIHREFGSEHDPLFDPLIELWRESDHVIAMARQFGRLTRRRKFDARRLLEEYLMPRELWARTYVQWVAAKLEDQKLLQHLAHLRTIGVIVLGKTFAIQWEEAEFSHILLFEKVM